MPKKKNEVPRAVSATYMRNNFSEVLDAVEENDEIVLIKRRGKVESAVVDADVLENLLMLADKDLVESIVQARADVKAGRLYTLEEVFGEDL